MSNGRVNTQWTVWCNDCAKWYQECMANRKSGAIRVFKKLGWKKGKDGNWRCPEHAKKKLEQREG